MELPLPAVCAELPLLAVCAEPRPPAACGWWCGDGR